MIRLPTLTIVVIKRELGSCLLSPLKILASSPFMTLSLKLYSVTLQNVRRNVNQRIGILGTKYRLELMSLIIVLEVKAAALKLVNAFFGWECQELVRVSVWFRLVFLPQDKVLGLLTFSWRVQRSNV